jgi:hypothetical protein
VRQQLLGSGGIIHLANVYGMPVVDGIFQQIMVVVSRRYEKNNCISSRTGGGLAFRSST